MKITMKYRILFLLSAMWMIGTSIRFLLLQTDKTYAYDAILLDKIFDWGIMLILGLTILIWVIYNYYKSKEKVF